MNDGRSGPQFRIPSDPSMTVSPRELEVIERLAAGLTNAEISDVLFISQETVKTHMVKIKRKLKARTRAHIIWISFQRGYLKVPALEPHETA